MAPTAVEPDDTAVTPPPQPPEPPQTSLFDLLDVEPVPEPAPPPAAAPLPPPVRPTVAAQRQAEERALQLRAAAALAFLLVVQFATATALMLLLTIACWLAIKGHTGWGALVALLALALGGALFAVGRAFSGRGARPLAGAELHRAAHPELWAAVDELAEKLGVPTPHRIVVDGTMSVGPAGAGERREMLIGLPALVGLDRDELRAVIAHELAHEAPARQQLTTIVRRTAGTLESALTGTGPGVARYLLTRLCTPFLAIAGPVLADNELAADDAAARLVGPGATASALHRRAKLEAAWRILTEQYLPLGGPARRRPPLADGLRNVLAARGPELDAARPRPPASIFDRHPALPERLGRLSALPPGAPGARPTRGAPAFTLLGRGERELPELERGVLVDDDPPAEWTEVAELAGLAEQERVAAVLARAALAAGVPEPVTLGGVLDAVARGDGPRIVDPLLRPGLDAAGRPAAATELLRDCLAAFVAVALLRAGLARFRLDWSGPSRLERRDADGEWRPWDGGPVIAGAAATSGGATPLRLWLISAGADLGTTVAAAPEPPPRVLSAFADAQLEGPFGARPVDLVLWTTGLLLAPAPQLTALTQLRDRLAGGARRAAADRVVRLAEQAGTDPESVAGGWWIANDLVRHARLRDRRTGFELALRLQDGAGAVVTATERTTRRGTPGDDLARLLGDRLSTLA